MELLRLIKSDKATELKCFELFKLNSKIISSVTMRPRYLGSTTLAIFRQGRHKQERKKNMSKHTKV